jgi:hypothetical protein
MKGSRVWTGLLFGLIGIAVLVIAVRPAACLAQAGINWAGKTVLRQQLEQQGLILSTQVPEQLQQLA